MSTRLRRRLRVPCSLVLLVVFGDESIALHVHFEHERVERRLVRRGLRSEKKSENNDDDDTGMRVKTL